MLSLILFIHTPNGFLLTYCSILLGIKLWGHCKKSNSWFLHTFFLYKLPKQSCYLLMISNKSWLPVFCIFAKLSQPAAGPMPRHWVASLVSGILTRSKPESKNCISQHVKSSSCGATGQSLVFSHNAMSLSHTALFIWCCSCALFEMCRFTHSTYRSMQAGVTWCLFGFEFSLW